MDNGETEAEIEFKENRTGGQYKYSVVEFFTVKGKIFHGKPAVFRSFVVYPVPSTKCLMGF